MISDKDKLLAILRDRGEKGVHTSELRRMGASGNPSQRRLDLLADGYEIRSERESYRGRDGKTRPGARFILESGPGLGTGNDRPASSATESVSASVEPEADSSLFAVPDPAPQSGSYRDPDAWEGAA